MLADTITQVTDDRLYHTIRSRWDYLRLLNLHRLTVHPDRKSAIRLYQRESD
jgi:hypothetical protein